MAWPAGNIPQEVSIGEASLWRELLIIIGELSPAYVEIEQGMEQEGGGKHKFNKHYGRDRKNYQSV